MKPRLVFGVVLLGLVWPWLAFAQVRFALKNYDPSRGINVPILDAQGNRLGGTNYLAELYGGPTPGELRPALGYDSGAPVFVHFFTFAQGYGYLDRSGDEAIVDGDLKSDFAWLQLRAWDASLGNTYEEAASLGRGGYGESVLFYAHGTPFDDYKAVGAPLAGLQSFSLRPAAFPGTPAATRLVATTAMQVGFATNGFSTNGFAFSLVAATNATYVTEFSNDLRTWSPLSTNHAVDTVVWVRDFGATNSTARFYRARFLPEQ